MIAIFNKPRFSQNGDTIVEVMLALVILSIVLTAAYTLSNRATRIGRVSLERTEAANLVQGQAELIKNVDRSTWDDSNINPNTSLNSPSIQSCTVVSAPGVFSINEATGSYQSGPLNAGQYIIWTEGFFDGNNLATSEYIDFYTRAFWQGPGDAGNQCIKLINRVNING